MALLLLGVEADIEPSQACPNPERSLEHALHRRQPRFHRFVLRERRPRVASDERASEQARDPRVLLIGIVRDYVAGVIPGADLTVLSKDVVVAAVSCNREGRFQTRVPEGAVELSVDAQGYASRKLSAVAPSEVQIVLYPESVVRGRVITADEGTPLPSVPITLLDRTERGVATGLRSWSAVSDEHGEFEIPGVPPGEYEARSQAAEWAAVGAGPIAVPFAEDVTDVEIEMTPALTLRGWVRSDAEDFCLRGAVDLVDDETEIAHHAEYFGGGEVVFSGLLPGQYRATVRCAEGLETFYPLLDVSEEDDEPVEWRVDGGEVVTGVVIDERNRPVPSILLTTGGGPSAVSGPDGRFVLAGLRRGCPSLHIEGVKWMEPRCVCVPQDTELVISIERPGRVLGRLESLDGEPLAGFLVGAGHKKTKTDVMGRFVFPALVPGSHPVWASHPTHGAPSDGKPTPDEIFVLAGETAEVTLTLPLSLGELSGEVIDVDGFPVVGAIVSAQRDTGYEPTPQGPPRMMLDRALTDEAGRFRLRAPDGAYWVDAQAPGRSEVRQHAVTGDHLRLVMSAVSQVVGEARYADGARPRVLRVALRSGHFQAERLFHDSDGKFSFQSVPRGPFSIHVQSKDDWGGVDFSADERLVRLPNPITLKGKSRRSRTRTARP